MTWHGVQARRWMRQRQWRRRRGRPDGGSLVRLGESIGIDRMGGHPVGLGDSKCSDWRGLSRRAQVLP
jgi:hypothetical protein